MIRTDDLDRVLQQWFEGDAPGPEPRVLLATVIDTTRRRRPRPEWLVRARGGGIAARPVRMPSAWSRLRPLWLALLLGLLAALALAAAVLVGTRPSPVPPGISNGWIAFAASPITAGWWGAGEFRDIYLMREGADPRRIIGFQGDGRSQACPRFSPDGSRLAYAESDESDESPLRIDTRGRNAVTNRSVIVVELGTDGEPSAPVLQVEVPFGRGPLPCPEWSPDGDELAFFTGSEVWVVDAASGTPTTFEVSPTESDVAGYTSLDLEWAPDGRSIAVTEPGRIRSIPVDGSEPTVLPVGGASSLGWLVGGRQIVYMTTEDAISSYDLVRVVDLDTGVVGLLRKDATSNGAGSVVVSPDGSRIAYQRYIGGHAVVMDADGTNEIVLTGGPGGAMLWSPDGTRLLGFGWDYPPGGTNAEMERLATGQIETAALIPGSPAVVTSFRDLGFEFMSISHITWQAVHE